MYFYLILAVLFGAGAVSNLSSKPIDELNAYTCLSFSILLLLMFIWIRISHSRSQRTIDWLLENKNRITDKEQHFQDAPIFDTTISKKTKLQSFKIVTSALIVTSESELGLEIRKGFWAGIFATTWTLLFGWWGFPFGPIRTIKALGHNLSGGKTIAVDYVILTAETGMNFETGERFQ